MTDSISYPQDACPSGAAREKDFGHLTSDFETAKPAAVASTSKSEVKEARLLELVGAIVLNRPYQLCVSAPLRLCVKQSPPEQRGDRPHFIALRATHFRGEGPKKTSFQWLKVAILFS